MDLLFVFLKALIFFSGKSFQHRQSKPAKNNNNSHNMPFSDVLSCVFRPKVTSNLLSKIVPVANFDLISFQYFQYGFSENLLNAITQKFANKPRFSFMINPVTFATYLKLTLKRFPKMHPTINFWVYLRAPTTNIKCIWEISL